MGYKKCPICELNYILDTEECCNVCNETAGTGKYKGAEKKYTGCFFVFQATNYQDEMDGRYISAPAKNRYNKQVHHWESIEDVKVGDFIVHSHKQHIVAISMAIKLAENGSFNAEHNCYNREVKLISLILPIPIYTKQHFDNIKNLQPAVHGPLNKNGDGNMGYLFVVNTDMIRYFLNEIGKMYLPSDKKALYSIFMEEFNKRFSEGE